MRIHPVKKSGNGYCGPSALSILLGIDTDEAAALLRSIQGRRAIRGTWDSEMRGALEKAGYSMIESYVAPRPTLKQWNRMMCHRRSKDVYLLSVGHHYAVVKSRFYCCGLTGKIVNIKESPKWRSRVRQAWRIGKRATVSLQKVVAEVRPPRPPDTERKPRQEAKRLAAEHGIQLDLNDPPDTIYVNPPDELERLGLEDPREDGHYCYDWIEALEVVKEYVEFLLKARRGQEVLSGA